MTVATLDLEAARALLAEPGVMRLMALLNDDRAETRIVGGAVRNALIGRPVTDIDFATTLTPDEVLTRAKAADIRTRPTGVEHGTVTLVTAGRGFEVTTLRRDVSTDGRRAVVAFTHDFAEDAVRRDFTINQLMLDAEGRLHDMADGLSDLAAGRVRFIGDAHQRIREDYLRILRFFRFSAQYGLGPLDHHGLAASVALKAGLQQLSRERIWAELARLLAAPRVLDVLASVIDRAIWAALADQPADLATLAACMAIWPDADATTRLAALALRHRSDATALAERFRLAGAQRARLEAAVAGRALLVQAHRIDAQAVRVVIFRHGEIAARDALATLAGQLPFAEARRWAAAPRPRSPWRGADLVSAGLSPGPLVGAVLAEADRRWEEAGFPSEPEAQEIILRAAREHCGGG